MLFIGKVENGFPFISFNVRRLTKLKRRVMIRGAYFETQAFLIVVTLFTLGKYVLK